MRGWRLKEKLAARWPLQGAVGVVTPDVSGHGYPGTLVNAPTWGVGPFGGLQCIELDGGTQHVNVGDVTQLNAVEQFTLCGWMNQDVIDQNNRIFWKLVDANNRIDILTSAGGRLQFDIGDGTAQSGYFDYSTVVSAGNWHHIAEVYDGSQADNASRLVVYVDGVPVTLTYYLTIPATTPDLAGYDASIGHSAQSFDGRLWDMRLLTVAATRDEINQIIHGPVPYLV